MVERSPVPLRRRSGRVGLIALLTGAMAGSAVLVFAVGALGPLLIRELSLSPIKFGLLTSAFYVSATVAAPITGRIVDRVDDRSPVMAVFLVASCSLLFAASSPSYFWLLVAMIVGGVSTGASNPASNALIARYFPLGGQGMVIGAKQSGVYLGAVVAGFALPPMAVRTGWRASFLVLAVVVLGGAIAVRLLIRSDGHSGKRPKLNQDDLPVIFNGRTLVLAAYAAVMGSGATAITVYVAVFANDVLSYSESRSAGLVGVLGLMSIVGRIGCAWICERLVAAQHLLVAFGFVAVLSSVLVSLSSVVVHWLVWLGMVGVALSGGSFMSVLMLTLIRRDKESGSIGRTTGTVQSGFYFGLLVGPLLFGYILDTTGSYQDGWLACNALFATGLVLAFAWRRAAHEPGGDHARYSL